MKVIALVSESQGEVIASVYSADREFSLYFMIAVFLLAIILIGGKKGAASVMGLGFTIVCVLFLFLPMIYSCLLYTSQGRWNMIIHAAQKNVVL